MAPSPVSAASGVHLAGVHRHFDQYLTDDDVHALATALAHVRAGADAADTGDGATGAVAQGR